MLNSKKGLSPLIAAVLLIVVVVGIGAVITGMVRGMFAENKATIESKDDEMVCSRDVVVSLVNIDGDPQICRGSSPANITAVLENSGSADIDDFQMKVYGTTGFYSNDSLDTGTFTAGDSLELTGTFVSGDVGTVEQVKLIPKLKKSGEAGYHFCAGVALSYEGIGDCTP